MTETAAQQGIRWVRESVALFRMQPNYWMLWSLVYIVIFMVLPSLPVLGFLGLLTVIIWPACMAFVVMLYRQADLGLPQSVADIWQAMQSALRNLMLLGLTCLVYAFIATYAVSSDLAHLVAHAPTKAGMSESQLTQFIEGALTFSVKVMLLLLPLFVTTWFSPMLITLNGYTLVKAIKSSLAGMLQYAWAMGLSWLLMTVAVLGLMLVLGLLIGLLGAILPLFTQLLMPMLMLAVLLMTNAMMFAFQYISYKDVFKAAPLVSTQP